MRFAFLYTELSSYFLSCLKALKDKDDHEILLVYWPKSVQAPFEFESLSWIDCILERDQLDIGKLHRKINDFNPHVIYISGWSDPVYVKVARKARSKALIIAGIDNQWKATFKQYIAILLSPFYLKSFIDVIWVAGKRQQEFANRLGYSNSSCWTGVYTCDWERFSMSGGKKFEDRKKAFLYVGRYSKEKGIQTLAEAYLAYREQCEAPWDLVCIGTGPYTSEEWFHPSIQHKGFIQPKDLPQVMNEYAAFILPSSYEPWGLVIHEAASSGLPLICSASCGATDHLVMDTVNGFLFPSGAVEKLKEAMVIMSQLTAAEWSIMSQSSLELSKSFTPTKWSEILVKGSEQMLEEKGIKLKS